MRNSWRLTVSLLGLLARKHRCLCCMPCVCSVPTTSKHSLFAVCSSHSLASNHTVISRILAFRVQGSLQQKIRPWMMYCSARFMILLALGMSGSAPSAHVLCNVCGEMEKRERRWPLRWLLR
jgi:hypothetical protein